MSDKQMQKSGDNSQLIQIGQLSIGIDEKRAREICKEIFDATRKDLTEEAYRKASERVQKFEEILIHKMGEIDGAMNAFSDPAFQFVLANAHKSAASTSSPMDYSILTELLIKKIEKKDDRTVLTGIDKAVDIVDKISKEALLGLTVLFAVQTYTPTAQNMYKGFDTLDSLFQELSIDPFPIGVDWLDHLDILTAVRISSSSTLLEYENYLFQKLSGYCVVGIRKDTDDYNKVIQMIKDVDIQPNYMLCANEMNENYVRLNVACKDDIEKIIFNNNINGKIISQNITDLQKQQLYNIYGMYENNVDLLSKNKALFCTEITKRPSLNIVKDWWNQIPYAIQLTSVGNALAYANLKIIHPNIPKPAYL